MMNHQKLVNYARALFRIEGTLEQVYARQKDLDSIKSLLKGDSRLGTILTYPQLTLAKKITLLEKLIGRSLDIYVKNLVGLMIQRKWVAAIPKLAKEYHKLVIYNLKEIDVDVTTASSLTEEEKALLHKKLEKRLMKKVQLNEKIDPHLLGGLTILVHDQHIDLSIRGKFNQLKKQLLKAQL